MKNEEIERISREYKALTQEEMIELEHHLKVALHISVLEEHREGLVEKIVEVDGEKMLPMNAYDGLLAKLKSFQLTLPKPSTEQDDGENNEDIPVQQEDV